MDAQLYEKENVIRFFTKLKEELEGLNEKLKEDLNQTKDFTNIKERLEVPPSLRNLTLASNG